MYVKGFVDMKYKDGSTNTDDQVTGLLIALLFAGQHTSSITSTWSTLLASRYRNNEYKNSICAAWLRTMSCAVLCLLKWGELNQTEWTGTRPSPLLYPAFY